MNEIDPYVRILVIRDTGDFSFPGGFQRYEELLPFLRDAIYNRLSSAGAPDTLTNVESLAAELFEEFVQSGAMGKDVQQFAGIYYKFNKKKYDDFREKALSGDPIHQAAERIGPRFFQDSFAGYLEARRPEDRELALTLDMAVPASDRIVTIGDNGADLSVQISEIKEEVRTLNDEDGKLEGRRDRIMSELSAGQELLKSRTVRVQALIATIGRALNFIAKEFAGGIIGDKAVKLLQLLQTLFGL